MENSKLLELSGNVLEQTFAIKHTLAIRDAALWRLRWRHANTMVLLFEDKHDDYYYTAYGEGPCSRRYVKEFIPGRFVEYKHTPCEWVKIWQNVAEKLLSKVRETNKTLNNFKALGG